MPKTVETRVGVCYNDFKYCTKGETGMLISLVVPCYNEEESLPIFYKEASKIAQQMGISHGADFEFIFVDDGSKDRTLQIARELHRKDARVRYISFSRNFGKEAGIYAGLKAAKGDYVATMDADLQDPPSLLPEMLELLLSGEYDCAATRRTTREGEPPVRSWFAKKFYQIINKLSDTEIVDGARDFRLMSRKMTDAVLSMAEYNRFSKGIFSWVGFKNKVDRLQKRRACGGHNKVELLGSAQIFDRRHCGLFHSSAADGGGPWPCLLRIGVCRHHDRGGACTDVRRPYFRLAEPCLHYPFVQWCAAAVYGHCGRVPCQNIS